MCFLGFQHQAFGGFVIKRVLLWPNYLVSYVLNEKRQNERKGKVKEFSKLGKKNCFKVIDSLKLNTL